MVLCWSELPRGRFRSIIQAVIESSTCVYDFNYVAYIFFVSCEMSDFISKCLYEMQIRRASNIIRHLRQITSTTTTDTYVRASRVRTIVLGCKFFFSRTSRE